MSLARPRLALRASVPPARSELRLKGQIALSPAPESPFDPIVSGARVLLEDATGGIVLDETVPGGAFDPDTLIGWRHDTETGRWIYAAPPSQGVQRLVLRRVAGRDDAYRFRLKASLVPTALPTPEELPLKATLVLDPPVARNGQCGEAYFGGGPSGPECSTYGESRLVCR
jgi:hypothetical protein